MVKAHAASHLFTHVLFRPFFKGRGTKQIFVSKEQAGGTLGVPVAKGAQIGILAFPGIVW